jgi:hypothetical protein
VLDKRNLQIIFKGFTNTIQGLAIVYLFIQTAHSLHVLEKVSLKFGNQEKTSILPMNILLLWQLSIRMITTTLSFLISLKLLMEQLMELNLVSQMLRQVNNVLSKLLRLDTTGVHTFLKQANVKE